MIQHPRIVYSPLGKRWYIVTRYREREGIDVETGEKNAYIVAQRRYDVTEQMAAILSTQGRRAVKRGKAPVRVAPPVKDTP